MKWLVCLFGLAEFWGQAATLAAQSPLDLANRFFDAVRAQDGTGLRTILDPNARIVSTGSKQGTPVVRSVTTDQFIAAATKAGKPWNQRIWNAQVLQDQNLALIWAPFDFRQDGQVKYCGVLALQMVRSAAGWRISQVAESQRNSPCPGPPS
jgi:hypothetical protein